MNLPDDLKNYRAPLGVFQLIEEGAAFLALIALIVLLAIFWPYVN